MWPLHTADGNNLLIRYLSVKSLERAVFIICICSRVGEESGRTRPDQVDL